MPSPPGELPDKTDLTKVGIGTLVGGGGGALAFIVWFGLRLIPGAKEELSGEMGALLLLAMATLFSGGINFLRKWLTDTTPTPEIKSNQPKETP